MNRRMFLGTAAAGLAAGVLRGSRVSADEVPKEYQAAIAKGLDWVAKNQARDGHWEAIGGQYAAPLTGLGGVAPLLGRRPPPPGEVADNFPPPTSWIKDCSRPNPLPPQPKFPSQS